MTMLVEDREQELCHSKIACLLRMRDLFWLRRRVIPCPQPPNDSPVLELSRSCRSLQAMFRQLNPDFLCIAETKISDASGILAHPGYPNSLKISDKRLKGV